MSPNFREFLFFGTTKCKSSSKFQKKCKINQNKMEHKIKIENRTT